MKKIIGFIGGGNMAMSLVTGLVQSGHSADMIWVSDINEEALQTLKDTLNVNVTTDNQQLVEQVDVLVLAVKPQVLKGVCQAVSDSVRKRSVLVVSIAAGISQASLSQWLGQDVAIVRCMPNTPAVVLTAATALHANAYVDETQKQWAENILRAVGLTLWVEYEAELDAVTAVSGSGPAYYFLMMEAMERAAIELGLQPQTARLLVQQTALGAAKLALEAEESPEELRQRVTSPGGTTEKAVDVFLQGDFIALVSRALHAARDRSIELSKELGEE